MKKFFKGIENILNNFVEPGSKTSSPIISARVVAKTTIPQAGQVTSNSLKFLTGGKIFSLTDMHGHGLRLKVM